MFSLQKIVNHTCTLNMIIANMFLNNPYMKQIYSGVINN